MQTEGNSPQAFADFKQDIAIWKEVAGQAKVEVKQDFAWKPLVRGAFTRPRDNLYNPAQ